MAKINILDSSIYNKIAAGEVIERPASVVKELLDNSIDAGADDIRVEIKGGGLKSISVRDNGCGIEKEDVRTAFLPHATSKISSEKDLYGIKTLGFRGEALASIAAVSMTELRTLSEGAAAGTLLKLSGGNVTAESECGMGKGTVITVENLFFNTPARLKFIKSERSEEAEITNIVSRYILANPDIRIKLLINEKTVYQSAGSGLKDAVFCVYGKEALDNIIEIGNNEKGLKLYGFIGKPSYSKPNRTYQTLIINNRYVINSTVSAAVTNAFSDFMMKRQYPFYVLHLTLPYDFVDVNVHPNKLDVRFEDNKRVFSAFYQPIYNKLHTTMQSIVVDAKVPYAADALKETVIESTMQRKSGGLISEIFTKYDNPDRVIDLKELKVTDICNNETLNRYACKQNALNDKNSAGNAGAKIITNINTENEINSEENSVNLFASSNANNEKNTKTVLEQRAFDIKEFSIKCVLFNTYILAEGGDAVILIDQHAAHERLLYDKICASFLKGETAVQDLLVPFILNVNSAEFDFLYENIKTLGGMGFCTEVFGNSAFKVSSVPAALSNIDLNLFFEDMLKDLNSLRQNLKSGILKDILAKKACHAAVKAGDVLSREETEIILNKIFCGTVLLCPHGRPIALKYSKTDIEKVFRRIV